ncbi:MAG TPA: XRE family transcriptional regulator [Myxococcales bacterium]|nr:XRE family transcriptional regulator [Myxococcales bacterium]
MRIECVVDAAQFGWVVFCVWATPSLSELADRSDVAASTVHKIEKNQTVQTISVLIKLCAALNRRPDEWLVDKSPQLALSRGRSPTKAKPVTRCTSTPRYPINGATAATCLRRRCSSERFLNHQIERRTLASSGF